MKKAMVLGLLIMLLAAPAYTAASQEAKEVKTVNFFISGKAVWGEPMETVVAKFNESYPDIKVEYEVVGGGTDYQPVLAARARTNNLPDIFMIAGAGDFLVWEEFLEDLSAMEVCDHFLPVAKESAYYQGRLMGLPASIEGYGYIYNKALFRKAGIAKVPETFKELEAAAAALRAAGIQPFVSGYGTWWVIANHQLNVPFAMQDNPAAFLEGLNNGTAKMAGNEHFENLKRLIDLVAANTGKDPLTEDHNMQVSLLAGEKAAMIQQGNWKEAAILSARAEIDLGLVSLALGDDPSTSGSIPVGIPWYFVVAKDSAVKEEAKTFLNWLLNEPAGQQQLVTTLNSLPAYDHFNASFSGGISNAIMEYSLAGKTIPWMFTFWPQGYPQNAANILQEYVAGKIGFSEALRRLDADWAALKK